ncbi:hypothetical protein ACEWY4_006199 [Coilia grayii]|uniref:GATA-type domain-containing protein n=1 Tax=Coilia grayii TaxID=363190 RepID=A0ABD1KCY9_9TELE
MTDLYGIPPPKPLPSGLDFIPDAKCKTFTYLLGLEVVVQMRSTETQHKSPKQSALMEKRPLPFHSEPKSCAQCSTDITYQWWYVPSKGGTPKHLCKHCKTTNDKAIYQAHASKLEKAFGRARQRKLEAYWPKSAPQNQPVEPACTFFCPCAQY